MPSPSSTLQSEDGFDISVQLRHVCLEYPYSSLEAATAGFDASRQLGEGSAGTVFKGEMQDGSYAAVKVIDLESLGDNVLVAGFEEEVMILSKFRHPNVVVLMGWARQDSRRFLIYEFLQGGDVFGRLQKCKDGRHPFLWYERLSVCRDAATGLAHLHNATPHAFHRDVKSSNILLGPSGAKIADFGLSLVGKTRTQSEIDCDAPSGTPGYTCPHYVKSGKMTEGSEVYSFGMLLLEVLMNMMPAGMIGDTIAYPIQDCIAPEVPGALDRAIASADTAAGWPPPVAREVAVLGLQCIDQDEARRPSFNEICQRLRYLQEQFPPTCVMSPAPMPPPGAGIPMQTGIFNVSMNGIRPPVGIVSTPAPQLLPAGIPPTGMPPTGMPLPRPPGMPLGTLQPGLVLHQSAPPLLQGPPQFTSGVFQSLPPGGFPPLTVVQHPPPPVCMQQAPAVVPVPVAPMAPMPVEVALEVAHVHGAELANMKAEFRMLPLLPAMDQDGRRHAVLGRQHQPQWFESVIVERDDLPCISREAFSLNWGGPDPSQAALTLRVIGSNIILVDDVVSPQGKPTPLQPGSLITFAFQANGGNPNLCVILAFRVHCAPQTAGLIPAPGRGLPPPVGFPQAGAAAPPPGPGRASLPGIGLPVNVTALQPPMPKDADDELQDGAWELECIYASGLGPEAFWALSSRSRTLSLLLSCGAGPKLLGRAHQPDMFEALLPHENGFLSCISRSHVQIEEVAGNGSSSSATVSIESQPSDNAPTIRVTNLSQNVVVANRVLFQNDTAELRDGDTLSFATEHHTAPPPAPAEEALPPGPARTPRTPRTPRETSTLAQAAIPETTVSAAAAVPEFKSAATTARTDGNLEDKVSVVPFLTFRVIAPQVSMAPPPPSPFVMMSPPSLSVVDPQQDGIEEAIAAEGAVSPTRSMPIAPEATQKFPGQRRKSSGQNRGPMVTAPAIIEGKPHFKNQQCGSPDQNCVCQ